MSVRAYRIEKIAEGETFNLWHDERVMEIIEENANGLGLASVRLNDDSSGFIGLDLLVISKIISDEKVEEYVKDAFRADLAWAKKNDKLWIDYNCY